MSNHLQNSGILNNNQAYQNNLYSVASPHVTPIRHHHQQPQQIYHHQPVQQIIQPQYQQQVIYSPQLPQQQIIVNQQHYLQPQASQQHVEKQKPVISNNLNVYYTLLGLAEKFRQSSNYRLVIHCLESILTIKPALESNLMIDVHFNLCKYYQKFTTNSISIINSHLEKAVSSLLFF